MSLLLPLTWDIPSYSQSHTLTVRDVIEMQAFIDPYPFPVTSYATKDVKYSPDNRWFSVVTEHGILNTNELEATIWVFDTGAVRRFIRSPTDIAAPKPKVVARMAAAANDSAITQLRWLTHKELAFLGRNKTSDRSLFTADVITCKVKKVTPNGQDVTGFDIAGGTIAYTAAPHRVEPSVPSERVVTGQPLISLIEPEGPPFEPTFGKTAELWIIRHHKSSQVVSITMGKPLELTTNLLALSPSGHSVVITQYAEHIPKAWEEYEPFPCVACSAFRLRATPAGKRLADRTFLFLNPKQYALIDLDTGRVDPIDAPFGLALLYGGPEKAIWSRDGKSVILVNTYLPIGQSDGTERQQRLQRPCIALFDVVSKNSTCVATAKVQENAREEYAKTGLGFFLSEVTWNESANRLILRYETVGNENDPSHQEQAPEVYRQENGRWVMDKVMTPQTPDSLKIELRQDLNVPPALFIREPNGAVTRTLWDPNPQLSGMRLGEVSVYHWKDKGGREWTGGLVKPPNYVLGRQYPLVIQTHGFNRHEFMTVGAFTTAYAARPIAATGIVVLQVEDRSDLLSAPDEATINADAFLAAIDQLAAEGVVDVKKVGIIGFSRTGYHTLEALTRNPQRFASATIADSDFLGYMQRLIGVDCDWRDSLKQEGIAIYGSQPFGEGLKTWIEKAPAFKLDKVLTPLRIEVHDVHSLVSDWELYAALRLQEKPVDMIQLPEAGHVLIKPQERLSSEQGEVDWFDFWLNAHEDPDPRKNEQYNRWRFLRQQEKKTSDPSGVAETKDTVLGQ
jgi:hypothetical protein